MRALFVGLGSIGARHLQNLRAAMARAGTPLHVSALRSSAAPLPPALAPLVDAQFQALPPGEAYDLAFITNPTHLHAAAIGALRGRVGAFFIEKPIFEHTGYSLEALGLGPEQRAYVAAPLRWTALYAALREQLQATPVYSARVLCSSYLPGWRPDTDYRAGYSASARMGGGVTLDLIHEWDYLFDLFGPPEKLANLRGHFSHLDITSDDLSVYIAQYPGFLCELHLDYFGRSYRREAEFFSRDGSLTADFGAGTLTLPDGTRQDHGEETNRRFEREMDYFLRYAAGDGGPSLNSPQRALQVLQMALGEGMAL